ncbi:MAG TPA: VWA domain-containing protein [Vicinamibacterales bacterium]|nr:VWA domain-containing protein [Vicinamibacterales bacterium]
MRLKLLATVAGVCLLTAFTAAQNPKQIQVFASILDATGAPAKTVEAGDLKLMENGADAKVTKVEPVNWPVKIQILLDNGIGIGSQNVQHLKNGVKALIDALPENLEVTLVSTAPQPRFLTKPTTDRAAVQKGLDVLAPDTGAGRFVESLNEATQRIEKDKTDYFPVIISVGTTSGDTNVRDSDVERMMRRLEARPTTVHVIIYNGGGSSSAGANQTQVGLSVTQYTGGKYESINSATRIATLLPEFGKEVATAVERQSHQFRVTAERPAAASGDIGKISMGAKSPLVLAGLSFDGRIR